MTEAMLESDAELVARFVRGREAAAFEALVLRHGPMVLQVCRRVLRDWHDAEDVAQAVFLTLAQKAPQLREVRSLAGWLHRVTFRLALDCRRSKMRRRHHEAAAGAERDEGGNGLLRFQPVLDAAIDQLPERYRTAVLLHHLQGHTQERAAELLGCKASALSMRLTRARDLLRRRLRMDVDEGAVETALAGCGGGGFPPELAATLAGVAGHLLAGQSIAAAATAGTANVAQAMVWSERAVRMLYVAKLKAAAAVVVGVSLAAGGVVGAGRVLAGASATAPAVATVASTSPATQAMVPMTPKEYIDLALQEAAKVAGRNDQVSAYSMIVYDQLATGDIAGAQATVALIPEEATRGYMSEEIALAFAEQGDYVQARAVAGRIGFEEARLSAEKRVTKAEAIGLLKNGKPEEAIQKADEQEDPKARMDVLCALVREFAVAKDQPHARKALELAKKAATFVERRYHASMPSYLGEAEAYVGEMQSAMARVGTISDPPLRDWAWCSIALAQIRTGDVEGADQTMQNVGTDIRPGAYADCASTCSKQGDEPSARRFLKEAIAAYSATRNPRQRTWAMPSIVAVQMELGSAAEAMALAREGISADSRAMAYRQIAWRQTLREGPARAHAWVEELPSPLERAQGWSGIAHGLAERQKTAALPATMPAAAAAELVRQILAAEDWVHQATSLDIEMEVQTWSRGKDGQTTTRMGKQRIAFDTRRTYCLRENLWNYRVELECWNGTLGVSRLIPYEGQGALVYTTKPYINFDWYIPWLHTATHPLWFMTREDRTFEPLDDFEDWVGMGVQEYRGKQCYVVEWPNGYETQRAYVGVVDRRLYGIANCTLGDEDALIEALREKAAADGVALNSKQEIYRWLGELPQDRKQPIFKEIALSERDRVVIQEHWMNDYREIAKGCWIPMAWSLTSPGRDGHGYDARVVRASANEPLPDSLFAPDLRLGDGARVRDLTHNPPLEYPYRASRTAEEWKRIEAARQAK